MHTVLYGMVLDLSTIVARNKLSSEDKEAICKIVGTLASNGIFYNKVEEEHMAVWEFA